MIIKKYIVNNMNEAMTRIIYELGKDAVIVSQRRVRKPGIKGLFVKRCFEVTAAAEEISFKKKEYPMNDSLKVIENIISNKNKKDINIQNKKVNTNEIDDGNKKEQLNKIELQEKYEEELIYKNNEFVNEMKEMKEILNKLAVRGESVSLDNKVENFKKVESSKEDKEVKKMHDFLKTLDIEDSLIDYIIKQTDSIKEDIDMKEKVKEVILKGINISSEDSLRGKVILVGPTGVGKTTTIAKLAGKLALVEKKKVGLITIDTYRIGAVDQLRTYADIMGIAFKVVMNQKQMDEAIKEMEYMDTVLIDTTGRSSKNIMQISELRAYIDKINTEKIHLVLSCTTKNKDIESIIEGYKVINYNNVIITKMDETSTYGSIMYILDKANKPLSLVSTGQDVPDDIKVLNKEELLKLILLEDSIC